MRRSIAVPRPRVALCLGILVSALGLWATAPVAHAQDLGQLVCSNQQTSITAREASCSVTETCDSGDPRLSACGYYYTAVVRAKSNRTHFLQRPAEVWGYATSPGYGPLPEGGLGRSAACYWLTVSPFDFGSTFGCQTGAKYDVTSRYKTMTGTCKAVTTGIYPSVNCYRRVQYGVLYAPVS